MEKGLNVIIEADWNDGDYVTNHFIIKENQLNYFVDLKNRYLQEGSSDEIFKECENMLPSAPDPFTIHTITNIEVFRVSDSF